MESLMTTSRSSGIDWSTCPAEEKSTADVADVLEPEAPAALLLWNVELAEGIGGKTCEDDS